MSAAAVASSRLQSLLGFLDQDPQNLALLADAAAAAFDDAAFDTAWELIGRHEGLAPLTPPLKNLQGLVAMNQGDAATAAPIFEALAAQNPGSPALRFNLAWATAALADYERAAELLDDEMVSSLPNAPALSVEVLHHLGRLEEALARGAELTRRHPDDKALMAALAAAAFDSEDLDLARRYAAAAGGQPVGLAISGLALLDDGDASAAMTVFDQALAAEPGNARASLGKGLALLACQKPAEAAPWLDRAAGGFGTHLGTWVAAGWAYFVQGELKASRDRFETALLIDDTFAETHGGLAVLDISEGDLESGRRRMETAFRLDRYCFAAALARSMLLAQAGDEAGAEKVRQKALTAPMEGSGRTLAQAMGAFLQNGSLTPPRP